MTTKYTATLEALLEERERVLHAIPQCPEHGKDCVPHALEWIEFARIAVAAYNQENILQKEQSMTDNVDVKGVEKMDELALAELFTRLAKLRKESEILADVIAQQVLLREKTVEIAGVRATFSKPSFETPDYEGLARAAMPANFDLSPFQEVKPSTRWKEVCETLDVEIVRGAPKPAKVTIKFE